MAPEEVHEISIREVILLIQDYLRVAWQRAWVIVLAAVLVGGYWAYDAYTTPLQYEAKLTFLINDQKGGGGLTSILGQFGLGGGEGEFNLNKIIALANSRGIAGTVLLDSLEIDGRNDLIANHLLREHELVDAWELEDSDEPGPYLITTANLDSLSQRQRRVMNQLYFYLTGPEGEPLVKTSSDETTNILKIVSQSRNEALALALSELLYEHLSEFYIEQTTGGSRRTVDKLQEKADSVLALLNGSEYSLAKTKDSRLGIIQSVTRVRETQLYRDVQIYSTMYGEVLKNLETASFALSTQTPFFKV
ncbi:MAG: hypothetical protein WBA17_14725, partial [Saprospiraceae bacterium]